MADRHEWNGHAFEATYCAAVQSEDGSWRQASGSVKKRSTARLAVTDRRSYGEAAELAILVPVPLSLLEAGMAPLLDRINAIESRVAALEQGSDSRGDG